MDGSREGIHLRTSIVHVVFPRYGEAHVGEQVREHVAHHRPPCMTDVERPCGVGGNVFHVDAPAVTQVIGTVSGPCGEQLGQPRPPEIVGEPQVDEAGTGHLDRANFRALLQPLREMLGDLARLAARLLGEHERRVAGRIPVFRLARRLHRDRREVDPGRQRAGLAQLLDFFVNNA